METSQVVKSQKSQSQEKAQPKARIRRPGPVDRLKAERVEAKLAEVPGWDPRWQGQGIFRAWKFAQPGTARAYASYVSELADSMGQECSVNKTGRTVAVTLFGPRINGRRDVVDDLTFNFAKQLG
jgi:pterin-4a-carbinolamine dehydratase